MPDDGRYHWHWDPAFSGREVSSSEFLDNTERLQAAARALTLPTLLIRGEHSQVVSEEGVREFQALVPHAEIANIAAADHMVADDMNDLFSDVVIDFFERRKEN